MGTFIYYVKDLGESLTEPYRGKTVQMFEKNRLKRFDTINGRPLTSRSAVDALLNKPSPELDLITHWNFKFF